MAEIQFTHRAVEDLSDIWNLRQICGRSDRQTLITVY